MVLTAQENRALAEHEANYTNPDYSFLNEQWEEVQDEVLKAQLDDRWKQIEEIHQWADELEEHMENTEKFKKVYETGLEQIKKASEF